MASVHRPSLFPFSGLCISVAVLTEELGPCPDSLTHGGQMTNFGQSNVVEKIAHQLCIWTMGRLPLLRLTLGAEAWACQLEVRETRGARVRFHSRPSPLRLS